MKNCYKVTIDSLVKPETHYFMCLTSAYEYIKERTFNPDYIHPFEYVCKSIIQLGYYQAKTIAKIEKIPFEDAEEE